MARTSGRGPLLERKQRLAKLLSKDRIGLRYVDHLEGDGSTIFEHACKLGARRHRLEAHRSAVSVRPLEELAEDQKHGSPGHAAGAGERLSGSDSAGADDAWSRSRAGLEGTKLPSAEIVSQFSRPKTKQQQELNPKIVSLTTILGIVGAFVATFAGQALGWYSADEGAGLIGAVVGAIIVLVIWGMVAPRDRLRT